MARTLSPIEHDPTSESLRPSSVWTNDSTFADSAISMGSRTPKQLNDDGNDDTLELRSPSSPKFNLYERLNELAAAAWAAEEDSDIDDSTREEVLNATKVIESCLGEREQKEEANKFVRRREFDEKDAEAEQAQLLYVHQQLAATVESMRLRQQEQRHINDLAIQKLEDVGSTCAIHEQSIQSLQEEVELLKIENQKLKRDNDGFQAHAMQLTSDLEQKDLAVQAMSSAVAGLDGWIQSALGPERPSTRRVKATRGRGRFRSHYYVDVPIEDVGQGHDRTVDAREVRDGITAWVRGFRDVEDALNTSGSVPAQVRRSGVGFGSETESGTVTHGEDDWGEFQTASTARFE